MATAAKIEIQLDAQTAALKKGFGEARGAINGLGNSLSGKVASGMAKFHIALAAVQGGLRAVRGAINSVITAMQDLDRTQKVADRLGITADELNIFGFAAEQSGASVENMNNVLQDFQRRLGEAAQGSGEAAQAYKDLGLDAQALTEIPLPQAFGLVSDQLKNAGTEANKAALQMDIMGRSSKEVSNLIDGGSAALNEFSEQAAEMGLLMGDNRKVIEEANDAINRMKRAWGAFVQQIAILVAPSLEAIANAITDVISGLNWLRGAVDEQAPAFDKATKAQVAYNKEAEKVTETASEQAKALDKQNEEADKAIERATELRDQYLEAQRAKNEAFREQNIGAVTRSSAGGFSAVQQAARDRVDAERRHRAHLAKLADLEAAIRRNYIDVVGVGL